MAGIRDEVLYGNNVDFSGSASPSAQVVLDGQLLIGSTAAPNIKVGTLTPPASGIAITNASGSITFSLNDDLAALEGLSGTGLAARTASNTWATRTMQAPVAGFTITNPAGVAGDPTFALSDDLAAVEGLSGTGLAARTASNTWTTRSITGTANQIAVTNGDGISGNPLLSLASTIYTNISFDGGSNTLANYSNGTFTPNLTFGGGSTGITYSTQNGKYWRIGSVVFYCIRIVLTNKGSSTGAAQITGLPFSSANDGFTNVSYMYCGAVSNTAGSTMFGVDVNPNSTMLTLLNSGSNNLAGLTNSNFANNSTISISGFYWTS